jgi:uncharacterized membrane protein YphA (DoxX/SURF4 family)
MFVGIWQVHGKNGFDNVNKGYEFNLVLIAMSAMLLLSGGGLVSADAYLFKRGFWARGAQPG